jgi:hypothetical protein
MIRPSRYRSVMLVLCATVVLALPACSLFRSKEKAAVAPTPPAPPPMVAPQPAPPPPGPFKGARLANEEVLKELLPGKTTKAEVRDRFGIPREIVFSPGIETFLYYRDRSSGLFTRTTERIEMLTIRFDAQGLLKDFEYRFAGE